LTEGTALKPTIVPRGTDRRVEGLTTAATVWMTAALGIACGLTAWTSVGLAVALALLLLYAGIWVERLFTRAGGDNSGPTGHH
jgi:putative Mg2+ transporter-C (MgtC) family protein